MDIYRVNKVQSFKYQKRFGDLSWLFSTGVISFTSYTENPNPPGGSNEKF